jgi:hypothetical protein
MTCEPAGYFSGMSDAPTNDALGPELRPRRPLPRCTRCHRLSDVLVEDERGLVATACVDHLEWAFLTGVDAWTGRWRTA